MLNPQPAFGIVHDLLGCGVVVLTVKKNQHHRCIGGKTSASTEEITCFVVKRLTLKQLCLCYIREKLMPCIHNNTSLSDLSRVEKLTF